MTVVVNFRQWIGNQTAAQDKDRKDHETEREKRDEERFQKVVEGLGSERTEAKVGAAIMLRTFLQPGYERFYRQAFDLAVAHLRLRKAEASAPGPLTRLRVLLRGSSATPTASLPLDSLSQALITVFTESFRLARNELKKELEKTNAPFDPQLLDATNVQLDHAYLTGTDLAEAWLARASLREANLSKAQLEGANLFKAQLEGADLSLAQLPGADLGLAQLQGAILMGAQLQRAILREAQLERADLGLAQLQGAILMGAQLEGADLGLAQLQGANLERAQLEGTNLFKAQLEGADLWQAQLRGANPEAADSLQNTKMNGVTGLTPEQREACIKKGAIFDAVQQAPASATSSSSSPSPAQSNDTQAPAAPPAQVNPPPPETGGNGAASSQHGPES